MSDSAMREVENNISRRVLSIAFASGDKQRVEAAKWWADNLSNGTGTAQEQDKLYLRAMGEL
jgi:hypothetical protein